MPSDNVFLKKRVAELVSALRELGKNHEILSPGDLYTTTREIFSHYKSLGEFDPTDPSKTADSLTELLGDSTELITEDVLKVEVLEDKETKAKVVSFNEADLKPLLDEYDKYRETKDAEKIAKQIEKNPLLKEYDRQMILEVIKRKIELEGKIAAKISDPVRADIISDQVIITEQNIDNIDARDRISRERIQEIAEKIVLTASETKTPEEIIRRIQKDPVTKLGKEIQEEIVEQAELARATMAVNQQVAKLANEVADQLKVNGIELSPQGEKDIIQAVKEQVAKAIDEPTKNKINENEVKIYQDESGNVKKEESAPPLVKIIGSKIDLRVNRDTDKVAGAVKQAVKKADLVAEEISRANRGADAAGKMLADISGGLLRKGTGVEDIRAIMAIRFGNGSVVEKEKTIIKENEATEIAVKKGFSETAAAEKAAEATVIANMLTSPQPIPVQIAQIREISQKIEVLTVKETTIYREIAESTPAAEGQPIQPRRLEPLVYKPPVSTQGLRKTVKGAEKLEAVFHVSRDLEKYPKLAKAMESVRRVVQLQEKFDKLTGGLFKKVSGGLIAQTGNLLGLEGLKNFGVQMATRFGGETIGAMATQFAAYGFEKGLTNILGQLLTKGTVTAVGAAIKTGTAAAAEATASTVAVDLAAAGAAGTGVGIPVAVIILAGQLVWELGKLLWKNGEKILGKALEFLGIGSEKTLRDIKNIAGKTASGILTGAAAVGMGIVTTVNGILMLPIGSSVGAIVAAVLVGLLLYTWLATASTQTSSLVSPRDYGDAPGICIKKEEIINGGKGGAANCDPNINCTIPGMDKGTFVNLAARWSQGGGVNAARCYGAVVSAAVKAGINPIYALWAWLHESGASNYSLGTVEDFGIHGQPSAPPNNFTAQLNYFLKLDPASACPNLDYWLAFATNYLTGGCDPDKAVGSTTGRSYLEEMQDTWSWVSSGPMPSSIHESVPGVDCSGGGGGDNGNTQIGPDGTEYVCFGGATIEPGTGGPHGTGAPTGPISPMPTRNPSIPIPPGCPSGWPVKGHYPVTQGPGGNHTHSAIEAIDIMEEGGTMRGVPEYVTHPGVVTYAGYAGPIYGNLVVVMGTCEGRKFATYYAHLMSVEISMNATVTKGQMIGHVDNSGNYPANNDHVHYELRGCEADGSGCWDLHAFDINNYLPQPVPRGCFWNCGVYTN